MRKFILAITFIIASASIGASYVSAQEQDSKFKPRSRVVADSIRSKGTRFGKKVADGTEVVIDSVGAKAPRWGRKIADGTAVVVDSVGSKGERFGRKTKQVADTVGRRSKRAWKVMRGKE